jgi:hypothetical protein
MKQRLVGTMAILVLSVAGSVSLADDPARDSTQRVDRPAPSVDVAILLDVSGSMKQLIEATRVALWDLVNDLASAEPAPNLRVALLAYGGTDDGGHVRLETGLTADLDLVAEHLFALESEGQNEYVGGALKTALEGLDWNHAYDGLRLIFLAGNEPADQDPEVGYLDMAEFARREEVVVHAIYCGSSDHEHAETWKQLAEVGGGRFSSIDLRTVKLGAETPFDRELAELGLKLNQTYVPYGEAGLERQKKLAKRDERALRVNRAAAAVRAEAKTSRIYAAGWDLVDAVESGTVDLVQLREDELPEELRGLSLDELESHVEAMRLEREALRQRIAELGEQRRRHVREQLESKGLDDSLSLGHAMRESIRAQAAAQGLELGER